MGAFGQTFRFGEFELDETQRELRQNGRTLSVRAQVLEVLGLLIRRRNQVVFHEELLQEVWNGASIGAGAVSNAIYEARRAIGDSGRSQRVIQTYHGRGFRFVGDVEELEQRADKDSGRSQLGTPLIFEDQGVAPMGSPIPKTLADVARDAERRLCEALLDLAENHSESRASISAHEAIDRAAHVAHWSGDGALLARCAIAMSDLCSRGSAPESAHNEASELLKSALKNVEDSNRALRSRLLARLTRDDAELSQ